MVGHSFLFSLYIVYCFKGTFCAVYTYHCERFGRNNEWLGREPLMRFLRLFGVCPHHESPSPGKFCNSSVRRTLIDLRMPDINGIGVIQKIREKYPKALFIVLATYLGDVQALHALKAGAMGSLMKAALRRDLSDTIRAAHLGQRRIPPEVASELAEHTFDDALTEREVDVLKRALEWCR